jgi:cyclin-dependent kinase 8/11
MIQLNRELHHRNLVALREVILEDKSIYMVFEYAEHDFLVRPPIFPCTYSRPR